MKDIEKNDVKISKLFLWGDKIDLETPQGTIEVWMRVIGDADVNRARVYALRKSADLRKKLKDVDSDEHIALIPMLDITDKEKAVEAILIFQVKKFADQAFKDLDIKYPVEPDSDASLEEQEAYQKTVDEFPDYVNKLTEKAITKLSNKERGRLKRLKDAKLQDFYSKLVIESLCETEMYHAFQDMTVYFACFTTQEYNTRMFNNIEEYVNLPTEVKTILADFCGALTVDIETLKK